jgi:hypothetical protein
MFEVPRLEYRFDSYHVSGYRSGEPRIRFFLPFCLGMLMAMNLGAHVASWLLFPPPKIPAAPSPPEISAPVLAREIPPVFLGDPEPVLDTVLETYGDSSSREWVISFFARLCGSEELAEIILEGAARYAVSPSLAFALSWEESRYNYQAVNCQNRDGSIDRGLFQLNNRSFPKLAEQEFFSPRINTAHGMAHLRLCLDMGGSEITALAMYNAGTSRVRSGGTPRQTLDYTARVLTVRRKIDRVFLEEWAYARQDIRRNAEGVRDSGETGEIPADPVEIAALDGPEAPRPILLYPLSR